MWFKRINLVNKSERIKKIISIFGLLVVFAIIIMTFMFRRQIEKYAMTGYFGVFVACFAATATIFLPAPGIFVVIQYSQLLNPIFVIVLGGLGTSLGEMMGYFLGCTGKKIVKFETANKILVWFKKKTFLTIFVFSIIPLPLFDIVGIASGMSKINSFYFWLICFTGKLLKMAIYVVVYTYAKELFLDIV